MQPYFLPYLGYFQLMKEVDVFVVYDDIQYTKKGWMTRNNMLLGGGPKQFGLSVKKGSSKSYVCERDLSQEWFDSGRHKLMRLFALAYSKAPNWERGRALVQSVLEFDQINLFDFIVHSIEEVRRELEIKTPIVFSSETNTSELRGEDRVVEICRQLNARTYINPEGGVDLYSRGSFQKCGIELLFLKSGNQPYKQGEWGFVPRLSVVDFIMWHEGDRSTYLANFELIDG